MTHDFPHQPLDFRKVPPSEMASRARGFAEAGIPDPTRYAVSPTAGAR